MKMILKFNGYVRHDDTQEVVAWEIGAEHVVWIMPREQDRMTIRFKWLGQEISVVVVGDDGIDFKKVYTDETN
jgi:hypothetical protein